MLLFYTLTLINLTTLFVPFVSILNHYHYHTHFYIITLVRLYILVLFRTLSLYIAKVDLYNQLNPSRRNGATVE